MDRSRGRERVAENESEMPEWERLSAQMENAQRALGLDDDGEIETFPVMIRLNEIRGEIAFLGQRLDRFGSVLDRLERALDESMVMTRFAHRNGDTVPLGVTARANPMTHPITPLSSPRSHDNGRDEALATVRALFTTLRRSWWQRLPLIGS